MTTLGEALAFARQRIDRLDARLLLQYATGCTHADLLARPEMPVIGPAGEQFVAWVERRAAGEPLAQVEDHLAWSHRPDHELRHDLALAIDSLPPLYREALLLRDFEELTIEEMAQRLGVTREATKSRLHRARALVREYLVPTDQHPTS